MMSRFCSVRLCSVCAPSVHRSYLSSIHHESKFWGNLIRLLVFIIMISSPSTCHQQTTTRTWRAAHLVGHQEKKNGSSSPSDSAGFNARLFSFSGHKHKTQNTRIPEERGSYRPQSGCVCDLCELQVSVEVSPSPSESHQLFFCLMFSSHAHVDHYPDK